MKFYILDARDAWHAAAIKAAASRGYRGVRISRGNQVVAGGVGFVRPHAEPEALERNRADYAYMAKRLTMIQDATQIAVYENKSQQWARWAQWMPETWRFTNQDEALAFLDTAPYPLVSKSDVGASSVNVRILGDRPAAQAHVVQVFTSGIEVDHCAGPAKVRSVSVQRDYVLLQRFIPHTVTWRVNAIGRRRAAFCRYCHPDRPVAQTGNVEPIMRITRGVERMLEFANRFFAAAETKWCAIDLLRDGDEWRLLETSLAWPWPSPGRCNEAPIFGSRRKWLQMFDVMFDEVEAGVWQRS
jgi:hypothetical protein